nr:adhesion G-protein coupled receptor G7-like [Ciona intestinalis]|eukprot:XP_026693965.1 adhesion G-protein coupled receptor G7-like [Ciona intestinalis]
MLSAWGWMVVECVTMYRMFVRVFHAIGSNYVLKSGLAVYVTSGLVFGVTIGVTRGYFDNKDYGGWLPEKLDENPSYYISPQICWLHGSALRFGFMLPIALCFLTNCIGFFFVTRAITWGGTKIASTQSKRREGKQHLIRIVTITFLLGLTWFFAIPITVSTDQYVVNVFSWIFTIANTAQGVGMFFLFCVRREDVFKLWTGSIKQLFKKTSKTKDSTIFTGSNMKSTAGSDQMESTKSFDQRVIPSSEHEVDVTGIRSSTFHPKRTNEEEEVM